MNVKKFRILRLQCTWPRRSSTVRFACNLSTFSYLLTRSTLDTTVLRHSCVTEAFVNTYHTHQMRLHL